MLRLTRRFTCRSQALERAFSEASQVLSVKKTALKSSANDSNQDKIDLELSLADPSSHIEFSKLKEYDARPVMRYLHQKRFDNYIAPRLMSSASKWNLKDVFPSSFKPSVQLLIKYGKSSHFGAFCDPVRPENTVSSPSIEIVTNEDELGYYTLMMTDLDRPDPSTSSLREWCHWLVTDIPVTRRALLKGGSSPHFNLERISDPLEDIVKSASKETKGESLGKTILDYIPPHPAFSNPKQVHRYVFTLLKQPTPEMNLTLESILKRAGPALDNPLQTVPVNVPLTEGDVRIQAQERLAFLPTFKFAQDHDLELKGFGVLTSTWNIHTPQIFTGLGIHEPVYGRVPDHQVYSILKKVENSTLLASEIPLSKLNEMPSHLLNHLNKGDRVPISNAKLANKHSILLHDRLLQDSKEGKDYEVVPAHPNRLKKLSLVGAAGVVRAKEPGLEKGSVAYDIKPSRFATALQ